MVEVNVEAQETTSDAASVLTLADRVPLGRRATDDEILEAFLGWVADQGIELYDHQEEAVLEIMAGRHVILNTPTGSGKSLVAVAMHFRAMCRGEHAFYTSPIKALVSEKFFELCRVLGAENVGMLTGDASINRGAAVVCCTAEILANIAVAEGELAPVEHVVMDEFHYYADAERGVAWQLPLLALPQATFLLMSATLGDTSEFEQHIPDVTGRELSLVRSADRPVPLEFEWSETPIHEAISELVEGGRAPVYVVNFTQREAAELAQDLVSLAVGTKEERQTIAKELRGFRFDSVYGKDLQRIIKSGVGLHHAGLLPRYRLLVERLAQRGLLKVIAGTDTLGVGINVPIRTVLFSKLCKFGGEKVAILAVRDFKQIAGRAGRKGFDDRGWVVAQAPAHVIENQKLEQKAKASGKKKFTRKKAPDRGYVPWDEATYRKLIDGEPEALRSTFKIGHDLILNVLQRPTAGRRHQAEGYGALVTLVRTSYESAARQTRLLREAAVLFRSLSEAGVVVLVPREDASRGRRVALAEGLDRDFSLFHALSLYIVHALTLLDRDHEDYALDILTLCEAVLENPGAVLIAQERKAKSDLVAEMKAEGVEYEERMDRLERVTYPKPRADFVYDSFNAFREKQPWVNRETVRPKSIARDMYERYASFNDYVKEYGLQRSEGVLLRYINEAYKTLAQTIPDAYKSDEVLDILAYLRTMLTRVDSSLLQAWEKMMSGEDTVEEAVEEELAPDVSRDAKAFRALVRAELHRMVEALARRDYDEAAACPRLPVPPEGADAPDPDEVWDAARIEQSMAPFFEEYGRLVFDPRARMADKTILREVEDHLWNARQILSDPEGHDDWVIEGEIDLRDDAAPEGPLVRLTKIGI